MRKEKELVTSINSQTLEYMGRITKNNKLCKILQLILQENMKEKRCDKKTNILIEKFLRLV